MPDEVVLVHKDLPDIEYTTNPRHAEVLAASGWKPRPKSKPKNASASPAQSSPATAGESTRTQES